MHTEVEIWTNQPSLSRLHNRFLKNKSLENRMIYTQQSVSLLRKTKIRYYANLNEKKIR